MARTNDERSLLTSNIETRIGTLELTHDFANG
jgi:hypothetical protein